jgi:CHAT domain
VDDAVWERYRERVRADSPMGRLVDQRRLIEDLLTQAAELDARVTRVARSLAADEMRAFLDVLTMMRSSEFAAVSGGAGTDYQEWFAGVARDVEAGKITLAQQPGIDRMASLLGLSVKCVAARQLDPVCPAPPEAVRTGPSATVLAAADPLFRRYSMAQPRVSIGTADEALDTELAELRDRYTELRERQTEGGEDWRFVQWWCAAVTGSLARSAAIQRRTEVAVREFGLAAAQWDRIGESGQAADCLTRGAEAALAGGADVDEALAPLLRALGAPGRPGPATIGRAQMLVRLAQIYLDVGDHFDAGARAEEAASTLAGLGFDDPAAAGVEAAFGAWLDASGDEGMGALAANRTQARLSAVTEVWAGITRVRTGLTPGGAASTGGTDTGGTADAGRATGVGGAVEVGGAVTEVGGTAGVGGAVEVDGAVTEVGGTAGVDGAVEVGEAVTEVDRTAGVDGAVEVGGAVEIDEAVEVDGVDAAGGTAGAGTAVDAGGTELLERLLELTGRLGEEAHRVAEALNGEAAALGLAPATGEGDRQAVDQARKDVAARQAELTAQDQELNRLQDEYAQAVDTAQLESLLARTEALDTRVAGSQLTGRGGTAATVSVLRSDLLVQLGRVDEAAGVLAGAKDRLRRDQGLADAERRSLLVTVISRAAMAEGRRGDFGRMSELCGEGIGEVEHDRGKVNGPYLQDGYLRFRGHLYDWGVFAAHRVGDHESMLARSELAKARGVLGWAVSGATLPAHSTPAASLADEQRFHALTAALASGDAAGSGDSDRGEIAAERRALWERLMTVRSRSVRNSVAPAFSVAALQSRLAADEAVITYHWLAPGTLLAVTIDAGSLVAEKINLDEARRADLASLVADVGGITGEAPWLEREARRLGRLLLPSAGRELLAGKERLIISPHRLLHQLPFHAFGYDGAPLIERFAVSYVPNLTSLLLPAADAEPARVLALGVSSFADPRLVPLANAGLEAGEVAERYRRAGVPVTLLTDGDVTRARIDELRERGELSGFGVLHLVTHGDDVPVAAPFDAGLYLPAGRIDGLEISQWRLRAGLVVLSACYSARRAITGRGGADQEELFGDEVLGLQASFFAAGAREVLGALWPVADGPARTLMVGFHQHLSAGLATEAALRQAMLDARGAGLPVYYWAPYKIVRLGPGGSVHERSSADLRA